jgi:hypothetical protein
LLGDLSSVNQVFDVNIITSGNFNRNCDVDYSTAHVLSYLVAGMNYYCSIPLLFVTFLEKSFP